MKNSWSIIQWFWVTSKTLRLQSLINAVVNIVSVGLDFAYIWGIKLAVDIATNQKDIPLRYAAILLICIIICQITIGFSRKWISALLGVRSQNHMQLMLFHRLLRSVWNGRESRHSGDVLNRLERDVCDVTTTITETLPSALGVVVTFIWAFFYLYSLNPMLACVIVVVIPIFVILSRLYVHRMRSLTRDVRDTDSKIQSILTESIQHRMVLKTLERIGTMTDKLDFTQGHLRQQVRKRTVFSSLSYVILNAGFATGYMITFLWGVRQLHAGLITFGIMTAYLQLVNRIQGPFRDITKFIPVIISSFTAGERLMELEEAPLEEDGEPIRFPNGAGIRVKNISYYYEKKKRNILQNFSFDFPPGSSTAILGETGAGKTTLIRLILALLHPQEGSIEIYDEGRSVPASPLTRCNLTYVPQGNTLFSGTIRDNLLLGNPNATDEEMHEALKLACADFVLNLTDGLDSHCGEGGTGLSEGQAQRIAIARALLKHGNVLLLDEATSALDSETEKRLLTNLTAWMNSRQTLIFITHRPAVIDYCSQSLKLEKLK